MNPELNVNKECQDLIPLLTAREYNELKNSIKNHGQHVPIVVSDRTGQLMIIEGNHSYKICLELGLGPKCEIRHFVREVEEINFIRERLQS